MVRDNSAVKAMFVKGDNSRFLPEGTALPRLLIQNCWTSAIGMPCMKNSPAGRIRRLPRGRGQQGFFFADPGYGMVTTLAVE